MLAYLRAFALAVLATATVCAEDPVAALRKRIDQGSVKLPFEGPYGYLPALLRELRIPIESQVAVFSKTSIQSMRIEPSNPRVLYFNDSVSVGWVRGGFLEMAAQDPGNGIHFYVLAQRPDEPIIPRQDCVRCHTGNLLRVSSVAPSPEGIAVTSTDVDGRTPFSGLFGGWFVSGAMVPEGHRGNAVFDNGIRRSIAPKLPAEVAVTSTSDVVALLTFHRQMRTMNLLAGSATAEEIADDMLFADEADWPGPVRGDSEFARSFSALGPRDSAGRSLRDFDLSGRLMRYRCSYMIYSDAFEGLPPALKESVYRRMYAILAGKTTDARYADFSAAERADVLAILRETKKMLPEWFR